MNVPRKSDEEIETMARAGQITAQALQAAAAAVRPGISSLELDKIAEDAIRSAGAVPSFKGYRGYPGTLCVELNDVVVHGIPRAEEIVREGDLVGLDVGAYFEGFHGDSATTVGVGEIGAEARHLLAATEEALWVGIRQALPGGVLGDVCRAIQEYVEGQGFSCVTDLVGHGIGRQMHEPPQVPNFYQPRSFPDYDLKLRPGMVLAIEPMVNAGVSQLRLDNDQWTMRTADGRLSAHFEHTVAITKDGPQVLTRTPKVYTE
ncbi:MAG: type I methionyl aminopeptidase [Armatimonadota bacterium]